MSLGFLGFTIDVVGKVLIAYTAIRVHHRFWQEHKIDKAVFAEMHHEQKLGFVGIGLIIIGYLLQVPGKWGV